VGETLLAVEAYRRAIEAERRRRSVRTDAAFDFALLVAERNLASLFDEVTDLLEERAEELRPLPIARPF
jgi:hypothetical protein